MYTIERLNSKEYFNTKIELINFFGIDFDPAEADQGEISIIEDESETTTLISSKFDWEIFVDEFEDDPLFQIITPSEASIILGISERGVRDNCKRGKYKARQSGSTWLIDKLSL